MTNEKPLLSICIPTYNRSKYLKKSIESIVSQKEFMDGLVEIVISDNASTDDTTEIVRSYLEKFINIHYYRNEQNIVDRNFPLVLSKANGVLRRLCNDTQCFCEGSLHTICSIIAEYKSTRPYICWANSQAKAERKNLKTDFRDYVKNVSFWMTSSTVFSIWDNECDNILNDLSGCDFHLWQTKKSAELAYTKNSVLICNKKLHYVQNVENKDISYGLYQVFYKNYFAILDPYFKTGRLSQNDKDYLERDLLFNFFANWVSCWELQSTKFDYSKSENLKKSVWDTYRDKPYWYEFLCKYYFLLFFMKAKKLEKRLFGRE